MGREGKGDKGRETAGKERGETREEKKRKERSTWDEADDYSGKQR